MPEVNILVKAKDEVSGVFNNINNNLFGFSGDMAKYGLLAAGGVAVIGGALGKLAYDAAEVEPVRITFEELASQIGETSESMLAELRPAAMGTMSDLDLMRSANKLMMMGLADSKEEAAELTRIAVGLGMALGTDALPALENFTLMLANQSILRMDTFGLSSGRAREEINRLVDEGLSREEAFKLVVLDQGNERMKALGELGDTAIVKMGGLRTKFANVKDELGDELLPVLEVLLDDLIIPLTEAIVEGLGPALQTTIPEAAKATVSALQGIGDLIGGILEAIQRLDEWTSTHLAAPEARGYLGRAATATAVTETYLPTTEGGRWGQRVDINVYGINTVPEVIRAIQEIENHTGPGL